MPKDSAGHLIPGRLSPTRTVPASIPRPEYVGRRAPAPYTGGDLYTPEEVERIRAAGRIAARAIEAAAAAIRPGRHHRRARPHRARVRHRPRRLPVDARLPRLPEVVVHLGQRGDLPRHPRRHRAGGRRHRQHRRHRLPRTAYHGDLNHTFIVGEASEEVALLVERTREALARGISAVAPGRAGERDRPRDRGLRQALRLRRRARLHRPRRRSRVPLRARSSRTTTRPSSTRSWSPAWSSRSSRCSRSARIEWDVWADDWTVVTRDRELTAQFEHTLVVTERGAEILTLP